MKPRYIKVKAFGTIYEAHVEQTGHIPTKLIEWEHHGSNLRGSEATVYAFGYRLVLSMTHKRTGSAVA